MKTVSIRDTIQEEMRAAFPVAEEQVSLFYAMQEYHLGWRDDSLNPSSFDPGKLLRPQLAILACLAVGGETAHALPLAAGIQLIHDFSLIHDDIEDDSDTRRGRTTVWKQWGLAHGINAGDGMFVIAHLAMHRMAEAGVSAGTVLDVLRRFDQTILTICEGQFLDLSFEGELSITESDYLAMIGRKTAALIASALGLGAMVGGADAVSVAACFDAGHNLGMAFQVQDDMLGIWGDPALTGKPYAADIYRRKVSLPIIHALNHADDRDDLEHVYQLQTIGRNEVERAITVLNSAGSRNATENMAAHYHQEAVRALDRVRVGNTPEAQAAFASIRALTEKLVGRQA